MTDGNLKTQFNENTDWAVKFISESDKARISKAVEQAEAKTTGEIVTMLVRRSSVAGHVPLSLTLFLFVIILVFEIPSHSVFVSMDLTWLLLPIAILIFLLAHLLARFDFFDRIFIPLSDQVRQVENRALLEFYRAGIQSTIGHTGILIFISLFERRVVVLADEGISSRLPGDTWQNICKNLTKKIKAQKTAEGLIEAIQESGQILAKHFPDRGSGKNELPNQLVIKD